MVILLEDINPSKYKYFVYVYKLRSKYMYAEAKRNIYINIEESLLFWGKLTESLEEIGYQGNEYN